MERGVIPIDRNYEFEYRYYDRDPNFKYFNRKFEVLLLKKKPLGKEYILHMDNSDTRKITPTVYKASSKKKYDFGVTSLNWNDIKNTFLDFVVEEIGENNRKIAKKALGKLTSPKI